jgi:uncharacterized protein (TIGR02118 family)
MIARFGLLKADASLTTEQFDDHWRKVHGPLAARMPGLQHYWQHLIINKEQFGISHTRGVWDLDGFSELHFEDPDSMAAAVRDPAFSETMSDEAGFLQDLNIVVCEKHVVVPVDTHDGPFVKRMTVISKLPGMTNDEFRHEWLTVHASMVRKWPNVLGYVQNIVVDRYAGSRSQTASYDEVPIDGIVEFWFRDKEVAAELYASDIVQTTQGHAKQFLSEITPFFVETRQIV